MHAIKYEAGWFIFILFYIRQVGPFSLKSWSFKSLGKFFSTFKYSLMTYFSFFLFFLYFLREVFSLSGTSIGNMLKLVDLYYVLNFPFIISICLMKLCFRTIFHCFIFQINNMILNIAFCYSALQSHYVHIYLFKYIS